MAATEIVVDTAIAASLSTGQSTYQPSLTQTPPTTALYGGSFKRLFKDIGTMEVSSKIERI